MNLLTDPWLPFERQNADIEYLSVVEITSPDIVDLALPRADFQGAAYQFLIGLLQTAFAPRDIDKWMDLYEAPPSRESLRSAFSNFEKSFNVNVDGPCFMQDWESLEKDVVNSASSLLIDSPGASTITNNTDHFVKQGRAEVFCIDCATLALFTMQINAPSGGKGYRTGLRGGGPLTTLLLPSSDESSLWEKLWINIIDREQYHFSDPDPKSSALFPWMGPTHTSENGQTTLVTGVHELHPFWGMPRRFRLVVDDTSVHCNLCGREADHSVAKVRARNYGNNYDGPWRHPLTPYRQDPKKPQEAALSIKGQPGGIGYRHWEGLSILGAERTGNLPALNVLDYPRKADECRAEGVELSRSMRLWAFGYDMDNMKPRGWVGAQLPFLALSGDHQERLLNWLRTVVGLSRDACWQLRKSVKEAWFKRPSDAKGDMEYIDSRFWERTEPEFYSLLSELGDRLIREDISRLPVELAEKWYRHILAQTVQSFDELALSGPAEALNMKRITLARNQLFGWFFKNKTAKNFRKQAGLERADATESQDQQTV